MNKDFIALTKHLDGLINQIEGIAYELSQGSQCFGWIRDSVYHGWCTKNGIDHLVYSNLTCSKGFISDRILDLFLSSESELEADEKLNFLLLELCKEDINVVGVYYDC